MPVQAIEYIGRLKARSRARWDLMPSMLRILTAPSRQRKPGVPKDVRSHAAAETTDLQAWAQAAIKSGSARGEGGSQARPAA